KVRGDEFPDEWVVGGNHRDAWVYGAVDPNSGTAAMLEAAHGIGELLKSGWKPKRTIVFGSWDAEEEGLIGSTEWGEQHASDLANAPAYFNMDVAVSGAKFGASSVPSLKQFLRDVTKVVPSPKGGMLYDEWRKANQPGAENAQAPTGLRRFVWPTPMFFPMITKSTRRRSRRTSKLQRRKREKISAASHLISKKPLMRHIISSRQRRRCSNVERIHRKILPASIRLYARPSALY